MSRMYSILLGYNLVLVDFVYKGVPVLVIGDFLELPVEYFIGLAIVILTHITS